MQELVIECVHNGQKKSYPKGISLREILKDQGLSSEEYVAAFVNNRLKNLAYSVYRPKRIRFISLTHPAAWRMYVRSLCLLLYKSIKDIDPLASLRIEHPIAQGYFFKVYSSSQQINIEELRNHMHHLVAEDLVIERREERTEETIALLKRQGVGANTTELLRYSGRDYAVYHALGGVFDVFLGPLLMHTACLKIFDVVPYEDGYLLCVPQRTQPEVLEPVSQSPKLFEIFKEQRAWNEILGFSNIHEMNQMCIEGRAYDSIKLGEALHEKKIAGIADQITDQKRIILISGPSSSGKTTFSKRLAVHLMVLGKRFRTLSMDDYFVNREDTPLDEHGEYDFESIHAVDLALFRSDIAKLLAGEELAVPSFCFEKGERQYRGKTMRLERDEILLIEGIHALNPELMKGVDEALQYKIYVSALTTHSLNDHNWISTSDTRLIRRLIRDYNYRNYSAQETLRRWASVQEGEKKWIFPYQEHADAMFNSALIYELSVLRNYAEPILREVREREEEYAEAQRLLKFLSYIFPIKDEAIPPTSLLREFVGGSSFVY